MGVAKMGSMEIAKRALAGVGLALALTLATAPATAKPDDAQARALVLFDRGKLAYKEGRFDESILLLKEAYAIKAEPILLYNIARAHEAKQQFPEAVEAYKKYLATSTDPPDRADVEQKITTLEKAIAEAKREADAAAAAEAERKAKEDRDRAAATKSEKAPAAHEPNLVPWIIAGSGAAVMGVGAVFGVLALGKNGDAEDAASQADAVDQRDGAETLALVSTITLIVGGAALAGGATWGVIDLTSGGSSSQTGGVDLRIQGSGAAVRASF
jgi:tetratricopeptide (TPR) repeat protein